MPELGHVVFYVRDLQRSLRFYRELLGLELSGMALMDRCRGNVSVSTMSAGKSANAWNS